MLNEISPIIWTLTAEECRLLLQGGCMTDRSESLRSEPKFAIPRVSDRFGRSGFCLVNSISRCVCFCYRRNSDMSHISDLRRRRGLDLQTTERIGEKVATAEARIMLSSFNELFQTLL